MKKVLVAGYKSYEAGYLTKPGMPFNSKYFVEQFPGEKDITTKDWMHTYLSTRVNNIVTLKLKLRWLAIVNHARSIF